MKGAVHRRLLVFFVANPDEQLLLADAAVKLDCSVEAVRNAALTLSREKTVTLANDPTQRRGGKRRRVMSIGPALVDAINTGRT